MIITNQNQRPKRYKYHAAHISDMIGSAITSGRIRQIARGYGGSGEPIGWMQFSATVPDDGKFQLPFPVNHKYTAADVVRMNEFILNCKAKHGGYKIKLMRYFSEKDVEILIERSKRLKKNKESGQIKQSSSVRKTAQH